MIRAVAVLSLLTVLVLVLYIPSANPPERFLAQLHAEHEIAAVYWGVEPAARMLERGEIDYALVVDGETANLVYEKTIERLNAPDVTEQQFREKSDEHAACQSCGFSLATRRVDRCCKRDAVASPSTLNFRASAIVAVRRAAQATGWPKIVAEIGRPFC